MTQKIPDVAQRLGREELRSEEWLRLMAQLSRRTFEEMRLSVLEFLDTDIFHVSLEGCVSFLDPMIDSWDIDLKSFGLEMILNGRLSPATTKRFEFVEAAHGERFGIERGLEEFLKDKTLSGDATDQEIDFLKALRFKGRRPSALYYHREVQSLRDPPHFSVSGRPGEAGKS